MRLNRCIAGPVICRHKQNADRVVVCGASLGQAEIEGKIYLVPLDSKGGSCPYFSPIEMTVVGPEEVIIT